MSGFEAPGTGVLLDFAGTEFDGLEVTVDSVSLGTLTDIMESYSEATEGAETAQGMAALVKLATQFAGCLESWNLEKRGKPVPADYEGFLSLDHQFALKLIGMWISRTTAASPELGKDLSSGGTSPEVLTAAAGLSASLPS